MVLLLADLKSNCCPAAFWFRCSCCCLYSGLKLEKNLFYTSVSAHHDCSVVKMSSNQSNDQSDQSRASTTPYSHATVRGALVYLRVFMFALHPGPVIRLWCV